MFLALRREKEKVRIRLFNTTKPSLRNLAAFIEIGPRATPPSDGVIDELADDTKTTNTSLDVQPPIFAVICRIFFETNLKKRHKNVRFGKGSMA